MSLEEPTREALRAALSRGRGALVRRVLHDDELTPVAAFLRLGADDPYRFLLESVEGGKFRGRYSIIGEAPDLVWRVADGRSACARGQAAIAAGDFVSEAGSLHDNLVALRRACLMDLPEGTPPPSAGLFGYLGFSMMQAMECLSPIPPDPVGIPEAVLMRPQLTVVFDALRQTITLNAPVWPDKTTDADDAINAAYTRIEAACERLFARAHRAHPLPLSPRGVAPTTETAPDRFTDMVHQAKEYIAAGDAFQIVPCQRFTAPFADPPFQLYRALRRLNPSPFLFHFNFDDFSVVGSSPEILVRCQDGEVHIRPLAGTRPRGAHETEDKALEAELLADEKERAEHLMLIDLARNDVGRMSIYGSVQVRESFVIERYSHVMHITSHVTGRLRDDVDPLDALLSGFPAGTVSGTPKIRAVEIIRELEGEDRGVYGGGVGYFSAGGDVDTCIALRTGVVRHGVLHVRAGAGIVADSDPQLEHRETVNKAAALFAAADLARSV